MSTRRARVDALTDDVATLAEKVQALHDDLERALEEAEDVDEAAVKEAVQAGEDSEATGLEAEESVQEVAVERTDDADRARADGGNVGWQEIETAGPDGARETEQVEWSPVETE